MSISTSRDAITEYEAALPTRGAEAARPAPPRPKGALFRLRSAQPSRRAVLHLQAAGDPVMPADLARWFTERACHFYLAGLRLPGRLSRLRRPGSAAERIFADLDAVDAQLREADGMEHVIVSAQGQAAVAAALWCARRPGSAADAASPPSSPSRLTADALILYRPAWPPGAALELDIECPVLVLGPAGRGRGPGLRLRRRPAVPRQVAGHVTWLQLPDAGSPAGQADLAGSAGRRAFFAELGRWLGAYMYGPPPDRLL